jgi:hypothetical protein
VGRARERAIAFLGGSDSAGPLIFDAFTSSVAGVPQPPAGRPAYFLITRRHGDVCRSCLGLYCKAFGRCRSGPCVDPPDHRRLDLLSGAAAWFGPVQGAITVVFGVFCVASIARQVIAFRAASGERRKQLKWLGAGGALTVVFLLVVVFWTSAPGVVGNVLLPLAMSALPVSIGVGILKYRLYEIDRLVSRTLSYALLTALLVGVFIGLIALTTDALALSGRVGVAASTLAAAALFNPLRVRIQRLVDRRFNRARYDAEATVAALTARLRDAVEIDAIRTDLLDAVNRAVEPSHASVWIRP